MRAKKKFHSIGEFARAPQQPEKFQTRKMFLDEVNRICPNVIQSLYDEVFVNYMYLFPFNDEIKSIIFNALGHKKLETWNKTDDGKTSLWLLSKLETKDRKLAEAIEMFLSTPRGQSLAEIWNKTDDGNAMLRLLKSTTKNDNKELVEATANLLFSEAREYWNSQYEDLNWLGLDVVDEKYSNLTSLRDSVRKWAQYWKIETPYFCDVALSTMEFWGMRGENSFIEWFVYPGDAELRIDVNEEEEVKLLPKDFPRWLPFNQSLDSYIQILEQNLKQHLQRDPIWSLSTQGVLNSHMENLIKLLLKEIKETYCDKVIAFYESNGYKRFSLKTRADEHTEWTIRTRILSRTDEEVTQTFKKIAKESKLEVNAIKKAVAIKLDSLGLPKEPTIRPKRGRPSKRSTS